MADAFEAKYLEAGDQVLHREKVTHRAAFVLVGSFALAGVGMALAGFGTAIAIGPDPQGLLGSTLLLACGVALGIASVVGSVVRVLITSRELILHAGFSHEKRIPLGAVTGLALTRYDAAARQRAIAEGRGAFVAMHPTKELVQVEWKGADGKDHVAFVSSEAPEALAEQIRRASAAAKAGRVRIAEEAADGRTGEEIASDDAARDEAPRERTR